MRAIQCLFFALLVGLTYSGQAQKIDISQLKGMKIRNVGPAGMSGRVTAIDAIHGRSNIIYIGTASGGVWKSTSGGINWKPIFDKSNSFNFFKRRYSKFLKLRLK